MPKDNAEYQRRYRERLRDQGYKQVQGIYAPDDEVLRDNIRQVAKALIDDHIRSQSQTGTQS